MTASETTNHKRKVHFEPEGISKKQQLLDKTSSNRASLANWMREKGVDDSALKWYDYLLSKENEFAQAIGCLGQTEYLQMLEKAQALIEDEDKRTELTRHALGTYYTPPTEENKCYNLAGDTVRVLRFETVSGVKYPVQFSDVW